MKLNSFVLTKSLDSRFLMGFQFLKEKFDKTAIGEYVGLEMRLKKGIRSFSELYICRGRNSKASVSGGGVEKQADDGKTILYFSSVRCKFPNPSVCFKENYLVRKVPFGVHPL